MNSTEILVQKRDGSTELLNLDKLFKVLNWASEGLEYVSISEVMLNAQIKFFSGIKSSDIHKTLVTSVIDLVLQKYKIKEYKACEELNLMAGRLIAFDLRKRAFGDIVPMNWESLVKRNVELGVYDKSLLDYSPEELKTIDSWLKHDRDFSFSYGGISQLGGKYLVKNRVTHELFETPQHLYMRIPTAVFSILPNKESRLSYINKFYEEASQWKFSLPTPIMAGMGTTTKQGSSCVGIKVGDDLVSINEANAAVVLYSSKKAGIGLDVSQIRPEGSAVGQGDIKHTGLLPFIKQLKASLKSVAQGGTRGASATLYFQMWHYEFEELIVLKDPKGTEENRERRLDYGVVTNGFLWQRLLDNKSITLFDPHQVPDLYEAFYSDQSKFAELYEKYEKKRGIRRKKLKATKVWNAFSTARSDTKRIYPLFVDNANNHGPFDPSIDPIHMSNLCFSGDTLVAVADGRNAVSIKQLAKEGGTFPVYSARPVKSGNIRGIKGGGKLTGSNWVTVIRKAKAFKTGTRQVVKVTLSNGDSFKCTPDHQLALTNGKWVDAANSLNCRLEPFASFQMEAKYRCINSASNCLSKQNRLIWEFHNGPIPKGMHLDHIDRFSGDEIENLQLLTAKEHYSKTALEVSGVGNSIHLVNKKHLSKIVARTSYLERNPRFSGFSDMELVEIIKQKLEPKERYAAKIYNLWASIGGPRSLSKNRFQQYKSAGFESKMSYVKALAAGTAEYIEPEDYTKDTVFNYEKKLNIDKTTDIDWRWHRKENGDLKYRGLKVVSVESAGKEDVYDISVKLPKEEESYNNHNFYIITSGEDDNFLTSSGVLVHNCAEVCLPSKNVKPVTGPLQSLVQKLSEYLPSNVSDTVQAELKQALNLALNDKDYTGQSLEDYVGRIFLCTLANINLGSYNNPEEMRDTCHMLVMFLNCLLKYQDYPVIQAKLSTQEHAPLGIGIINLSYFLAKRNLKYGEPNALAELKRWMEHLSYYLIEGSVEAAKVFGVPTKWHTTKYAKGEFPWERRRDEVNELTDFTPELDWDALRAKVLEHGMANSCLMAQPPAETSAQISGATNGIEPPLDLVSEKTSKDGSFITTVPELSTLHKQYQVKWDINCLDYLKVAAVMQVYIDQSMSTNTWYVPNPNGKIELNRYLGDMYLFYTWGGKTLYYDNGKDSAIEEKPSTGESLVSTEEVCEACTV